MVQRLDTTNSISIIQKHHSINNMTNTRNRRGLKPKPDAVVSSTISSPDAVVSRSSSLYALPSPVTSQPCPTPIKSINSHAPSSTAKRKSSVPPSPVKSSISCALSSTKRRNLPQPTSVKSSSSVRNINGKRTTAEECEYIVTELGNIHPDIVEENNKRREGFITQKKKKKPSKGHYCTPVTDAVINTMLSQNTTAANQNKAFTRLKEAFPKGWEEVATADVSRIEDAIRVAGLAQIRAERMQNMLQVVREERGEANFEYLQNYDSPESVQQELSRFKGMGPKTISCVCLFVLGFPEFPVDTHVLRISKQLGWIKASTSREAAYEYLNDIVPDEFKLDLHCLLVTHGKWCYNCAANGKPQFKPKEKFVCPLIGMKGGLKVDKQKNVKKEKVVKVKKEKVVKVKREKAAVRVMKNVKKDLKAVKVKKEKVKTEVM